MPLVSFALVVLAAIIHASWNLLSKRAAPAGASFVVFYNVVACVAYLPWVAWLLATREQTWSWPVLGCIVVSAAIHLGYSLCLQRGYQVADLSVVYPVARGSGPMLSSLGAFLLLGERPSAHGVLGLFAVVFGIGLICTQGDLRRFRASSAREGARWGMATGALIAAYTVVDGYGVKALGIDPVLLDWFSNLVRAFMLAPVVLAKPDVARQRMKGRWLLAVGVGVLSPLSYILVLTALEQGAPLSLVAPAREMSMRVGAFFGMVLLREPVGAAKLIGCFTLLAGVLLLALA